MKPQRYRCEKCGRDFFGSDGMIGRILCSKCKQKIQDEVADLEMYRPHIVFEIEGEVHVVPRAFFDAVVAGRAKIEDCQGWRSIIARIIEEWLCYTGSQGIL